MFGGTLAFIELTICQTLLGAEGKKIDSSLPRDQIWEIDFWLCYSLVE